MNTAISFRSIRERLGMSQEEVAAAIGCTQGNVSLYERGQTVTPQAAMALIDLAAKHGLRLTMGQVYGTEKLPPLAKKASAAP